jgi:hypothetical protein
MNTLPSSDRETGPIRFAWPNRPLLLDPPGSLCVGFRRTGTWF